MLSELKGKEYQAQEAKEWSLNIADGIREGVKTLHMPRCELRAQAGR